MAKTTRETLGISLMTRHQFRAALASLGLTQAEVANILDISTRTAHGYANGWPIPKVVEMALAFLLMQR